MEFHGVNVDLTCKAYEYRKEHYWQFYPVYRDYRLIREGEIRTSWGIPSKEEERDPFYVGPGDVARSCESLYCFVRDKLDWLSTQEIINRVDWDKKEVSYMFDYFKICAYDWDYRRRIDKQTSDPLFLIRHKNEKVFYSAQEYVSYLMQNASSVPNHKCNKNASVETVTCLGVRMAMGRKCHFFDEYFKENEELFREPIFLKRENGDPMFAVRYYEYYPEGFKSFLNRLLPKK